jgi:hypothetical protein
MRPNKVAVWTMFLAVTLAAVFMAGEGSRALPLGPLVAAEALQNNVDVRSTFAEPIATNLCGRGLSGRCTRGRAACGRHGTPAQCAAWQKWSAACTSCAQTFVKCRQRAGRSSYFTCDRCIAAHDACEAKIRAVR